MTVEGRRPVLEALRAGAPVDRLWVARGERQGSLREIVALARAAGVPIDELPPEVLAARATTRAPQGVIARIAAAETVPFEQLLEACARPSETGPRRGAAAPLLVVLDGLQDPGNVGSLIRTAEAAGACGVVLPRHRAVGLTAAVVKTSAGATLHMPIAQVTNIPRALEAAKEQGLWVAGADMAGTHLLWEAPLTGPLALVVGGEGKGLSRLVRERCDYLVRIPMFGRVASLNAAIAGALLLYEVVRQRQGAAGGKGGDRARSPES